MVACGSLRARRRPAAAAGAQRDTAFLLDARTRILPIFSTRHALRIVCPRTCLPPLR